MTNKNFPPTNRVSVMTMNLRFGLADDGENSWANRQHAYPKLFSAWSPDFIGTQEANDFQTHFLNQVLCEHNFIGMRKPSPDVWQDNILFYKKTWYCLNRRHCFLSDTPERESKLPESKWPRQCTLGIFEKRQKKIILVNTHFDFKESVQEKSARLIVGFLSEFPELPVIITGDFNASPESPAHRVFMEKGFKDIFDGNFSSTYHGFTGRDDGDHIDWILYRGNLKLCSRKIIKDRFSGIYPSDHFPIHAVFEWV